MCYIEFNQPKLDWNKISKVQDLIGRNLSNYDEFKSLIDMYLKSERGVNLIEYCKKYNKNYDMMLNKCLTIYEVPYSYYEIIIPGFLTSFDIMNKNELSIEWLKTVEILMNK